VKELIRIENVTKEYPGVIALNNASISFNEGEVHAIIGENGAGKSTLMKVLSGAITPTKGYIYIDGQQHPGFLPKQAIDLGVQVVYQELNQIPTMTVMDNIFIGNPPRNGILVDKKKAKEKTKEILHSIGMDAINPNDLVYNLTSGYQQMVEIAKALTRKVRVLILDEPTSSLSNSETEILFDVVRRLKKSGVTILFISHRLEEVMTLADRVTVMRDGEVIATRDIKDITRSEMINMMVGRDFKEVFPSSNAERGDVVLEAKNITGPGFHDVSFKLHKGEILGFGGLVGSGRTETVMGIFGGTRIDSGSLIVKGKEQIMKSPKNSINNGIALLPENRKTQGLILSLPIKNNIDITSLKRISKLAVINAKKDDALVKNGIETLKIKTPSMYQTVVNLSGGNQQKVVVAKWLAAESDILIFDEPTKGIDVSAKKEIYELLCKLAEEGKAIILISSDIEELMGVSDRLSIFYEGTIIGEIASKKDFDKNKIMEYASGIKDEEGVTNE
jgi:ribose transport system ATP-binding protein